MERIVLNVSRKISLLRLRHPRENSQRDTTALSRHRQDMAQKDTSALPRHPQDNFLRETALI